MGLTEKTEESIDELIEIARDGADFYRQAANEVTTEELKNLFKYAETTKTEIIIALSDKLHSLGVQPKSVGTFRGTFQQLYGKILATFGDTDYHYVAELEESEDRLLHAFKKVLKKESLPDDIIKKVTDLLPKVKKTHELMRNQKQKMKN
ncbi:PA2169 family four-helix-bundle protein [Serratia ureilytica]|uniref:PA2169 family four-helix-bundle protein n=1 Tax=Serratia ureilytica TaxID=300181 RepID=UPI00313AFEF9